MGDFAKAFVPFVLATLFSVLAYFFTEVVKEVRSSPLLVYSQSEDNGLVSFKITNASTLNIPEVRLQVYCPGNRICFEEISGGDYLERGVGRSLVIGESPEYVEFAASFVPRTWIEIAVKPISGLQPRLVYRPDMQEPQILTLLPSGLISFVAKNYLEIMTAISIMAFVVFVILSVLLVVVFWRWQAIKTGPKGD